jgi:hypothetical protein
MDKVTASEAKQAFGNVLARAAVAPVAIEKHGKVVAAMVSPAWLERSQQWDERTHARREQKAVEQGRLMAHQRVAIALLSLPEPGRRRLLQAARREVRRWQDGQLCSRDYIDRWNEWLALPKAQLVERMCSDAGGWGQAMRQNSPFAILQG